MSTDVPLLKKSQFNAVVYFAELCCNQNHHIEVPQRAIFMEKIMRFGPVGNTEKNNLDRL